MNRKMTRFAFGAKWGGRGAGRRGGPTGRARRRPMPCGPATRPAGSPARSCRPRRRSRGRSGGGSRTGGCRGRSRLFRERISLASIRTLSLTRLRLGVNLFNPLYRSPASPIKAKVPRGGWRRWFIRHGSWKRRGWIRDQPGHVSTLPRARLSGPTIIRPRCPGPRGSCLVAAQSR